jgi:hypothetical protein
LIFKTFKNGVISCIRNTIKLSKLSRVFLYWPTSVDPCCELDSTSLHCTDMEYAFQNSEFFLAWLHDFTSSLPICNTKGFFRKWLKLYFSVGIMIFLACYSSNRTREVKSFILSRKISSNHRIAKTLMPVQKGFSPTVQKYSEFYIARNDRMSS